MRARRTLGESAVHRQVELELRRNASAVARTLSQIAWLCWPNVWHTVVDFIGTTLVNYVGPIFFFFFFGSSAECWANMYLISFQLQRLIIRRSVLCNCRFSFCYFLCSIFFRPSSLGNPLNFRICGSYTDSVLSIARFPISKQMHLKVKVYM